MERIVIEVDSETANQWRKTTPEDKQRLYRKIDQLLRISLKEPSADFWQFVDEIREEAQVKGLTEEELQRILNEE